jgi:hypothetical protein
VPGLMNGTAVSVNSFTVNNVFSTAKTRSEVNGICRHPVTGCECRTNTDLRGLHDNHEAEFACGWRRSSLASSLHSVEL